ncbi:homoserine kinase [SAR202 cluster bacterium AD-804-J14_MRT_500m]|nr:homoserine kinase [SAR202 cluster bacterium AD-804-J14_MRT_500m]
MNPDRVTIVVPATTANFGSAFDCMGMSLDVWNRVTVVTGHGRKVEISGEGSGQLPTDQENLTYRAAMVPWESVGKPCPDLAISCHNVIPLQRGMGSSAAAIVGGMVASNYLLGKPLSNDEVLSLAVQMEGHPDNVTPALLGGVQIVVKHQGSIISSAVSISRDIKIVLFIPDGVISTKEARRVLPDRVPREDAIYNLGRVALLVNALNSDRVLDLGVAMEDRLHQQYRNSLYPAMSILIREARNAGALGAFVSGSGPTVLAIARGREMSIAYEMAEAAKKTGTPGRILITSPSFDGAREMIDVDDGSRSF